MSLSKDQEIALLLGGTTRLPSPYPAVGSLSIITTGNDPGAPSEPSDLLLKITHRVSRRLSIARVVRLTDVRVAIAQIPGGKSPEGEGPRVLLDRELARLALEFAQAAPDPCESPVEWAPSAVLYVAESAPVLMTVESGLTAAESADYYPPLGAAAPGASAGARPFGDEVELVRRQCHPFTGLDELAPFQRQDPSHQCHPFTGLGEAATFSRRDAGPAHQCHPFTGP